MSVDIRTRDDAEQTAVDAGAFFDTVLPRLFESRPDLLSRAGGLALRVLRVEVEGRSWYLTRQADTFDVCSGPPEGADRRAAVVLTAGQLADLVNDQITPIGLMTAGTLEMPEGRIGHLLDWWLVLRSLLDDRPIHQPGDAIDLPDDLGRSFTLADDPAELRAFLESAGYLHLRGVFDPAEMAQISADMDAAAGRYQRGDGRSWWATTADGGDRVVRMQGFDEWSPAAAALLGDPRFSGLSGLTGDAHRHTGLPGNRIEALFKPIGVEQGISDVPWHKDCSLGRHSYECCSLTVGVSVTGAGPTSGQLRVIAGSHRALVWPSLLDTGPLGLPEVPLPTETGDVTVHLSCTLHMAQPPVTRERRVMYTSFCLPPRDPAAHADNRRRLLATSRENAQHNTSQPAAAAG